MRKLAAFFGLALCALLAPSAHAFIDGQNGGGTSTNSQTVTLGTVHDGDTVLVIIEKANNQAITPPTGYVEPSCGGALPKVFNGTANQIDAYTHVWHTGDTTTPVFTWTTAVVDNWITASLGAMSGNIDTCSATSASTNTTVSGVDLGVPAGPNEEEFMYYVGLASADTVASITNLTTDGTTTAQHLIKAQAGGSPSAYLYAINVGPQASPGDAGQPKITLTNTAVNAALDILFTPAAAPTNVIYPAGSTKNNASGLAYYSQIDATPVMGTAGVGCGTGCAWQAPFVDTIAIYQSWFTTETACDVFDWYILDGRINAARVAGKRISLGINALGNGAPTASTKNWIFGSSACTNSGQVDNVAEEWNQSGYGPAKCTMVYIADPRDANYQHAANDAMDKISGRYGSISGPGKPIVSVHPLGYAGLGTIEESYYNSAENASLNSGACNQTYYANGNAGVDTANFYGTTTHEDFGSLNHSPGVMTVASMAAAVATFEAKAVADWPNVQIINATVLGPTNLPQVTALLAGGNNTIGQFNGDVFANDEATYPHQLVFEMYGGVGCSSTALSGSPGCFDGVQGQFGYLPAFNANVGIEFQTASAQSLNTCTGLFSPSTSDCIVPMLAVALKDGVPYLEGYPADIATILDQPWLQAYSNFVNGRGMKPSL